MHNNRVVKKVKRPSKMNIDPGALKRIELKKLALDVELGLETLLKEVYNDYEPMADIIKEHCFVAGGALRSLIEDEKVRDLDIYFKSPEGLELFLAKYREVEKDYAISFISDTANALTLQAFRNGKKPVVQFIKLTTGYPLDVVSRFDFTNSMGYYDIATGVCNIEKMYDAVQKKELVYNPSCLSKAMAMKRVIKFVKQGYTISNKELLAVMEAGATASREEKDILINSTNDSFYDGDLRSQSLLKGYDPETDELPF